MEKLHHLSACEKRFWQIMVQCQRITGDRSARACLRACFLCQQVFSSLGDNYKNVLGIARDSPIYYQMKKVQKDLNEARASRD